MQSPFAEAKELHEADLLETEAGSVDAKAARLHHADAVTYDLTVGGLYTYYVMDGSLMPRCLMRRARVAEAGGRNEIPTGPGGSGRWAKEDLPRE
ncbi:hypothetical protein ABZ442_21315 [Streptomyces triculaminicus]|uniref:hypothetical protein n=1 Tax=Streptomyces triculaminicus TaxID=2816232 RepID=UPI0033ED0208